MNPISKRILALLMAAVLAVSALGGAALAASASEVTGSYVLQFDNGSQPYLYGSRYECKHSYNDPEAGENSVWTYWNAPEIFNLVYTGTDGESRSIAAYCTDADTSTTGNTYYRRINLENSTYHESGAAARLRSVILASFPYLTVAQVVQNVNAAMGDGTVQALTQGEVISATQQAIWEITHGDKYTVDDNYTGIRGMGSYSESDFVYPESLTDCVESDYTAANIEALYNYFLNLEGTGPLAVAASEYSFQDVVYTAAREDDGTYTVTASYTVHATIGANDSLTLTAACGGQTQATALTAAGDYSVTFTGLSDMEEVTIQVSGHQTGADVYLFDAEGDRTASQSMIGYDATTLPVFGQVTASPDRILNIYKTSDADSGKIPLANIEFDIYLAATMEDLESGKVNLPSQITQEEAAAYQKDTNYVTTLKTDAQGFATYNLTENNWPDGVYLVVERENSAVYERIAPFFAIFPATNEAGTGYEYTVNVYPKNVVESGPDIQKDVTEIDNDLDSFDIGETHTWIIRGGVPSGIGDAVKYVITDTMDYRLTLQGNFEVRVGLASDEARTETVILTADADYTLTTGTTEDADGNTVDTFQIALTEAGMDAVAAAVGSGNTKNHEIRVYFDAVIDNDAAMGELIPNQAELEYTNDLGIEYDTESDIPQVYTCGVNLLKVAGETELPLAGATFKLARAATEAELSDDAVVKESLYVDGVEKTVVFVDFYADSNLTQQVSEFTTTETGTVVMYGLAEGIYYIVETKAPEGYNLLTQPIPAELNSTSHETAQAITVVNTKFVLPDTGGMGTGIFTLAGVLLMGAAGTVTYVGLKKKKAE